VPSSHRRDALGVGADTKLVSLDARGPNVKHERLTQGNYPDPYDRFEALT
jgi:hypothetical protein